MHCDLRVGVEIGGTFTDIVVPEEVEVMMRAAERLKRGRDEQG